MIATLGILSLLQTTLLPGLVIAKLLKRKGFWENLLIAIGVSPLFNYGFVFIATASGIYTCALTFALFAIELLLLIYYYLPFFKQTVEQRGNKKNISTFFNDYLKNNENQPAQYIYLINSLYIMAFILASGGVLFYIKSFVFPPNATFVSWDAVVSWNRWALDWYHNHFPLSTAHYPQLIPANWSIIYQFIAEEQVKIFIKVFMGLIEVFIPLSIFALGVMKKKPVFFTGTFFICLLQAKFGSLSSGYVDSTIAFFGLLAIVFLYLAQGSKDKTKYLLFGAVFAAGSAVTKQAGLWIVITYFVLVFILYKDDIEQRIHHLLLKIAFIDLITILPWYAYKEVQIQAGLDNSEIQYVTTLCAQNKTYFQVFTHAVDHVLIYLRNPIVPGVILLALIIIFLLLSVKDAFWRKISTIIIIPYIFIWIFFFSYDIRNLEPVVPLIGFAMAVGFHSLSNLKVGIKEKLTAAYSIEIKSIVVNAARKIENFTKPVKPLYLLIAFTILILLSPIKFPNEYIIERSIEDQKMNVDFRLNQALYDYHEAYGFQGKILTDYQILGYLPGLEDYYARGNQTRIDFIDKLEQPEVAYGLTRFDNMLPEVKEYYDLLESENKIEPIFVNGLYVFFSVCHTSCE